MKILEKDIKDFIEKNNLGTYLLNGNFQLEKESFRVDKNGRIAKTPHPNTFCGKGRNIYINTGISDSQIKMITPVFNTLTETYDLLENLHDIVSINLDEEFLWPISIAKINEKENSITKHKGKNKLLKSLIYYKFSFEDDLLKRLFEEFGEKNTFAEFVDEVYSRIQNNYVKFKWILEDLVGSNEIILINDETKYLEIRLDLNPLLKNGINLESLYLIHLFLLFCFLCNEKSIEAISTEETENIEAIEILQEMREIVKLIVEKEIILENFINEAIIRYKKRTELFDDNLFFYLKKAKEYLEESKKKEFNLIGYEDMELSTQILLKEAIKRGIMFEILDRKNNFIMLDNDGKIEYIKQATMTSLDSYSTVLIMENKLVTKEVLKRSHIRVPSGKVYTDISTVKKDFSKYNEQEIVIKPNTTNFGIGITILNKDFSKDIYEKSIENAFNFDNTILVEEFIKGKEYRFFVIGDKVEGILLRVPANVIGDGKKTIKELVDEKNNNPLRGEGYRKPLEKIKLGWAEKLFLIQQKKDTSYIPKKDEIVYLRENSNISTGGDSIDYTDEIPQSYKNIAVKAAKAVGASICGVDMVIEDITKEISKDNYAIIELNFNPAIHIHCYPYKGKNRKLGEKILDKLGYNNV